MANSIVFQNNAEQLKTLAHGYDSTNNIYQALQMNSSGELKVTIDAPIEIGTINSIGTINKVAIVGTVSKVGIVGTLNEVTYVETLGTLNEVTYVETLGTLNEVTYVETLGTLNEVTYVETLGTLNKVTYVETLGTLNKVATVGTLNKVAIIGTLNSVVGTVKVNLVDRTFTSITQTLLAITPASVTYTNLIDISKYQETSWYLRNLSPTPLAVRVQVAVTPSTNLTDYPLALISETATVSNSTPRVITNDYYLKYNTLQISNTTATAQDVVVVFNARY